MGETYNKKEKEKNRLRKKQDKAEKMAERKANAKKGKTLEEMMAFIDENGNLSSTPPDTHKRKMFKQDDRQFDASKQQTTKQEDLVKTGRVTFFNETKGFGFIKDDQTQKDIFLHVSHLREPVRENDKVIFEVEKGPKGLTAVNVKKATE